MGGAIFKTNNSGENWFQQLNVGSYLIFTSIWFIDSLNGWTANINDWPYKTTDGGETWILQLNSDVYTTTDVYFVNLDTGWTASSSSNPGLYETIDGGLNWSTVSEVIGPNNFNFFPDPSHWIINGSQHK